MLLIAVNYCSSHICSGYVHDKRMFLWPFVGFSEMSYPKGITLLKYADDTMFCMEGSIEKLRNLSMKPDFFADSSCLQINQAKSVSIGFGLLQEEAQCSGAQGMLIGTLPMCHIGLPLTRVCSQPQTGNG